MAASVNKGKKRAHNGQDSVTISSPHSVHEIATKVKKPKRAETRNCPICAEPIPLRLLAKHSELESSRVETIIEQIGSIDVINEEVEDSPGPSSRSRLSALKARTSLGAITSDGSIALLQQAGKTIQAIVRRRKQRYVKFREMTREEETNRRNPKVTLNAVCPVCMIPISGDQDMIDGHVDSCLAHESERLERQRQQASERRAAERGIWEDAYSSAAGLGTSIRTRNHDHHDIDDELDVDGDEGFGEAQFTEGDILTHTTHLQAEEDLEVRVDGESEDEAHRERHLRRLIAGGRRAHNALAKRSDGVGEQTEAIEIESKNEIDVAILVARKGDSKSSLITALENKIQELENVPAPLLCRICIESYKEPTTSTGCWHTFCRECWLRCLGSTKLCPICKRITGASDLRRVYL